MPNRENIPYNGKSPADELWDNVASRSHRAMKRCFMTGKQCIFSSKKLNDDRRNDDKRNAKKIFVVMPYSPNLETFYRWSLKPFLTTASGYGLGEMQIQRADEVHDIGYIVCEKICRKIQESDLVLAEISLKNQNVFYEIGLAYGLERPIIFMRNADIRDDVLEDPCIKQIINPRIDASTDDKILEYPNVRPLSYDMDKFRLHHYIRRPWEDRISNREKPPRELKISALKINQATKQMEASQYGSKEKNSNDINLDFDEVLSGAINVAMTEIKFDSDSGQWKEEPWAKAIRGLDDGNTGNTLWKDFSKLHQIEVDGTRSYNDIADSIESSFCTIIDVSGDNRESSTAYFWLGFCHARGINAIPVYRTNSNKNNFNIDSERLKEPKLAFDIRSLWYAQYDESKPYEFKVKIREILERLFERDLPNRQKRAFWDRFSREKKLKIFTGAIHIDHLNREMVGDWDVRAVSELFAYLYSAQETMDIELFTPFYSPDTAFRGSIGNILSDVRKNRENIANNIGNHFNMSNNNDLKSKIGSIIERSIDSVERKINISKSKAKSTILEFEIVPPIKSAILNAVKSKAEECSKNAQQQPSAEILIEHAIISAIEKIKGKEDNAVSNKVGNLIESMELITEFAAIEAAKIIFVDYFCKDIDANLSDSNAIIIASPDVNPVAEYVLNKVYGVMKSDLHGEKQAFINEQSTYTGYKVFKEIESPEERDHTTVGAEATPNVIKYINVDGDKDKEKENEYIEAIPMGNIFPSEFYIEAYRKKESDSRHPLKRGFIWHASINNVIYSDLVEDYYAQTTKGDSFYLLGQLVVARYHRINKTNESTDSVKGEHYLCKDSNNKITNKKYSDKQKGESGLVVLLNGVSGPATFALAQILTGGVLNARSQMNSNSEKMLGLMNDLLDQNPEASIEGIVQVKIDRSNKDKPYTFNWDDISQKESENERFKRLLVEKFGIDWAGLANIEKIDDGKTIKVSKDNNWILFKYTNNDNNLKIESSSNKIKNFIAKKENKVLNIYEMPLSSYPQMHGDTRQVHCWCFITGPKLIKKCHVN